eukprot:TRINITY_DN20832_c0_g1_i2.p1 TRINITY_DN20832_c0_g1~~TRINITY_DN20832_c0_g1_i2.p1  ORF type:complete len:770 (+),score=190.41 TRINITY_DN20832_c0_g1_i2:43-2352(+)
MALRGLVFLSLCGICLVQVNALTIDVDPSSKGRVFDGIGGLSAGGSSRLLIDYDEPFRSLILDYLFKPSFGASLHILKLEIGGDAQSTDGTEPSHMRTPQKQDLDFTRGYEWWLLEQAKARNPHIKTYVLSWGFPRWVADDKGSPLTDKNVEYQIQWMIGARDFHNVTIDYIGVWNERYWSAEYIRTLRTRLNETGFLSTQIVAADTWWGSIDSLINDQETMSYVSVLGSHYPGTYTSDKLISIGKPLWSSEDYSTYNNEVGGGCWARSLNQNYLNGMMTSTITWNLIASYYDHLPFEDEGLFTAREPWSGHFDLNSPLWITAHTTQFTQPGWIYLDHGKGVNALEFGGSVVTLMDPEENEFSIIVEKMSHDHSLCIRPALPSYNTSSEKVSFKLMNSFKKTPELNVWKTCLKNSFDQPNQEQYFVKLPNVAIEQDGTFQVDISVDCVYTFSTISSASHGSPSIEIPTSQQFPSIYFDDFDSPNPSTLPKYFSDMTGSFSLYNSSSSHQTVLRQEVIEKPVSWCEEMTYPVTLIGDYTFSNVYVSVEFKLPDVSSTAGLVSRVDGLGCSMNQAEGIFLWIDGSGIAQMTLDPQRNRTLSKDLIIVSPKQWQTVEMELRNGTALVHFNGKLLFSGDVALPHSKLGFSGLLSSFSLVEFDNFRMKSLNKEDTYCFARDYSWPEQGQVGVELMCPSPSQVISAIDFASYGTPTGGCGDFVMSGACHSANSTSLVEDTCLNRNRCVVFMDKFGDPCPGVSKNFYAQVTCSRHT